VSANDDWNQFECLCCGGCCLIVGFVRLGEPEIARIAHHLGLSPIEVRERFTRKKIAGEGEITVLRDHPGTTRCIFLDEDNRCAINAVKPQQCREFPQGWRDSLSYLYCVGLQRLRELNAGVQSSSS